MNCPGCGKSSDAGARFCSGCGRRLIAEAYGPAPTRYVRPREGRMIAGVCAGIAMYYGWDVAIVRLVVALAILLCGVPVVAYLIAWVVMPNAEYALPPATGATVS